MSPHKNWAIGEEVVAADFNPLIANQIVATFASAAARAAEWPSPPHGAQSYLTGTNSLESFDGTNWVPAVPVGAWTPWAFDLVGGTLGQSPYDARFAKIGRTIIGTFWFEFGAGGVQAPEGTALGIRLPAPRALPSGNHRLQIGTVELYDVAPGTTYPGGLITGVDADPTVARLSSMQTFGGTIPYYRSVAANTPFDWSTSDSVSGAFHYEAAS